MNFNVDMLRRLSTDIFSAAGLPEADAALVTDVLIDADLRGIHSHGLMRLPSYVARLEQGSAKAHPDVRVIKDAGSLVLLDGDYGLGQVVANRGLLLTLEKAREHGIAAVSVRRSGHMGTVGYYTRKGAAQGYVMLAFTNSSPGLAPWGGREVIVGLNPWSIAIPTGEAPICLDIANSVAARGKIMIAAAKGVRIPEGWAIDGEGRPTTDPVAALKGAVLPMAGYKGYAITVMVELLAAVLSGASFLDAVTSPRDPEHAQDIGHLFIALDISRLTSLDEFNERMNQYCNKLRSSKSIEGQEVLLPGEPEERSLLANSKEIDLGSSWDKIRKVAERYHVHLEV